MKDRPAKEAWPSGWVSSGVRRSVSVRSSVHGRREGWGCDRAGAPMVIVVRRVTFGTSSASEYKITRFAWT